MRAPSIWRISSSCSARAAALVELQALAPGGVVFREMPPWPIWSYSESLPFVTRNRTDISSENATVPKTTNVKPFSAIPSINAGELASTC